MRIYRALEYVYVEDQLYRTLDAGDRTTGGAGVLVLVFL